MVSPSSDPPFLSFASRILLPILYSSIRLLLLHYHDAVRVLRPFEFPSFSSTRLDVTRTPRSAIHFLSINERHRPIGWWIPQSDRVLGLCYDKSHKDKTGKIIDRALPASRGRRTGTTHCSGAAVPSPKTRINTALQWASTSYTPLGLNPGLASNPTTCLAIPSRARTRETPSLPARLPHATTTQTHINPDRTCQGLLRTLTRPSRICAHNEEVGVTKPGQL